MTDEHAARLMPANRVNYQDQWSSHPAQPEREANIRTVAAPCPVDELPAWTLFADPDAWQQKLTTRLYQHVDLTDPTAKQFVGQQEFIAYVQDREQRAKLPEKYNGFYDRRLLHTFDPVAEAQSTEPVPVAEAIFSDENRASRKRLFTNYDDRRTLQQIQVRQIQTRTFDFDGQKYDQKEAGNLLLTLSEETDDLSSRFDTLEKDAFRWHLHQARQQGKDQELIARYELVFRLDAEREHYSQLEDAYAEIAQATHAVLKDDKRVKKDLADQIDAFNEQMQAAFAQSQTITVPEHLGELNLTDGYAAFLCPEPVPQIKGDAVNWTDMVRLYEQLEVMPNRAAQVEIAALDALIRWQATLF